ncbi:DUF4258 domain-containing protein [Mycolicibacterium elephantis]|uniref:DUF4258 domain-containing protein n=1 Tax=Mycolicibacterium elephantis TaxID=81858 RepID=UPI0009ED7A2B
MTTLIIRGHPRRRMSQRGITEADILSALRACLLHRPGEDDALVHEGRVSARVLIVVTVERSCTGTLTIKTAMWK